MGMEQKKERLEDWAENRKQHMKDMPWKDRVAWYVMYYWPQAFVVCLVVLVLGYVLWHGTIGKKETWFNCAIINCDVDAGVLGAFGDDFAKAQDLNPKKQVITLDHSYILDAKDSNITAHMITALGKLQACFTAGDMDLMIGPSSAFDYLDEKEFVYLDLTEVLDDDFMAQFDEDQIRYGNDSNGNRVVTGISLEGTRFLKDTDIMIEDPYAQIPYSSERVDHTKIFLTYLFEK